MFVLPRLKHMKTYSKTKQDFVYSTHRKKKINQIKKIKKINHDDRSQNMNIKTKIIDL